MGVVMSCKVDGGHAGISLTRSCGSRNLFSCQLLLLCQIGFGVEVGYTHILRAEVGRSTIDAVGIREL